MGWDDDDGILSGKTIADLDQRGRKPFSFTLNKVGAWQFQNAPGVGDHTPDRIDVWLHGHSKLYIPNHEIEAFATALLQAKAQQDLLRATKGIQQ